MSNMDTLSRFDTVSPFDYRYYGDNPKFFARLQPYVSEAANIRYLLRVELALVKTLAKWQVCPPSVVEEVKLAVERVTPADVYKEENRVHHNIRALVNCI